MRHVFVVAPLLLIVFAGPSFGQSTGPYVSGHAGVLGGEGGAALAAGGSVGYMTARRVGFELELSVWPDLDFGDLGFSRDLPTFPDFIPVPSLEATGRVLTFQSNFVGQLGPSDKFRLFVVGGGGVANVHRDINYRYPDIVFPAGFEFPFDLDGTTIVFPLLPRPSFTIVERRMSSSESALCLNAGGVVEYAFSSRVSLGVDARYTHVFTNRDGLDTARVTARARWAF